MKQKKRIALFGMVAFALILTACNGDSGNNNSESEGDSSSSAFSSSSILLSSSVGKSSSSSVLLSSSVVKSSSSLSGISSSSSIEYGTFTYEGQTYKTVVIGTQTWMAENLNYAVDSSWCYNDSTKYCEKYGRLYQWASAMGLSATYNSTSASDVIFTPQQGVCPVGWHIPTDAEWTTLENAVGDEDVAGTALKNTNGWYVDGNGTDTYGFSALQAGNRDYGSFYSAGCGAYFWSATEDNSDNANNWYLTYASEGFYGYSYNSKYTGFSVRCLKDE